MYVDMKRLLIKSIKIYQKMPGPWHGRCRYIPTCSKYAIEAIDKYGSIKGTFLALKRIIRCNPFSKGGYDPVPKEENNEKN